jgi:hypothetical protein
VIGVAATFWTGCVSTHRAAVSCVRRRPTWRPPTSNKQRPSASVRVNPGDGSCGRMAVTEMSPATLLDSLATPDPAA